MATIPYFKLTATPLFSLKDIPKERLSEKVQKTQQALEENLFSKDTSIDEAPLIIGCIPGDDWMISGNRSESAEKFSQRLQKKNMVPAPSAYLVGLFAKHYNGLIRRMQDFTFIEVFDFASSFVDGETVRHLCIRRVKSELVLDFSSYVGNNQVNYLGGISPKVVRGIFFEPWRYNALVHSFEPDLSHLSGKMIG